MPRPSLCRWSLLVAVALLPGAARAEPLPSLNLRGFSPPPGPKGMLYLESVNTPGHLQFNTVGWLSWAYRPIVARQDGKTVSEVISQQTSLDLAGAIGLGKRVEVGATLPVVLYQNGDDSPQVKQLVGDSKLPAQALGDLTLAAKATLRPVDEEFGGFGLALVGRAGLPTGDRASSVGEGAFNAEVRLLAEMRVVAVSLQATAGFKARTEERTFGGKTWGDEIPWGVGAWFKPQMFGLDAGGKWRLGAEFHGALPAGPDAPFSSRIQSPAYLGANARYSIRDLHLLLGAEAGLTQAAGSAPARVVLGANWAPRDHDLDKDGIEDEVDECKNKPEDRDGFEDQDGCPDPDNDDDNVVDEEDKCPMEAEDEDGFQDEDGCPDPDNDNDGILDKDDKCPDEAGPASADPKQNGCPARDPDGDGVQGDADKCPDVPEDKDGFQDDDGCPDPDNDGDGILDKDDSCPNEKGEATPMPGQNGCPSPDRDQDAIPNELDKCPDQPENYNGFEDDDGCPDTPKGKAKPVVDVVERKGKTELVLSGQIRFVKNSSELEAGSKALVRALSRELATRPGLRVTVAVKPRDNDGGEGLAWSRSAHLVGLLVQGSRKPGSVSGSDWVKGKMPPSAEASGVALAVTEAQ